jgi:hypothetical protein
MVAYKASFNPAFFTALSCELLVLLMVSGIFQRAGVLARGLGHDGQWLEFAPLN